MDKAAANGGWDVMWPRGYAPARSILGGLAKREVLMGGVRFPQAISGLAKPAASPLSLSAQHTMTFPTPPRSVGRAG